MRNFAPISLALCFLAGSRNAQPQGVRVIDEGSFSISVNGQRTGRENFSITGTPTGEGIDYIAKATVVYGDRRLSPSLHADSAGTPSQYMVQISNTGGQQERWKGTIRRGRVSATIQSPRGESQKEFVVTEGALILDDDVYHQYYFVAHRATNGNLTVVIPRRNSQLPLRVASAGTDRVTVGTREIDARHLVLTEGDGTQRDVWVDAQGRVLKVAIPARGIVAVRDDPPR